MQAKLNSVMSIITNWCNCNKLSVNIKKSKVMLFGTPGQLKIMDNIQVNVGDNQSECVLQFTYLGGNVRPLLYFFHDHCDYTKSKTLGKIGALGRIRSFVDHETALMLYKTLILPLFNYCDVVYNC